MDFVFEIVGFLLFYWALLEVSCPCFRSSNRMGRLIPLHQSDRIPHDNTFLLTSFAIALLVFLIDYVIPALGTKKFGGSKKGIIGSTIGLVIGLLFLGPLGIIVGPFLGAYSGNYSIKLEQKQAFKSGTWFLNWFLTGVFLKFAVALVFCFYYIKIYTTHLI